MNSNSQSSNSQASNTRKPITATSRAYRQELAARAFTDAPRTDASGASAEAPGAEAANDSLEAGLIIKNGTVEQIREGAQATLRQLVAALERNKVLAIAPATGTKFDPHQHQAISVVPSEQEANTVVNLLQKGYLIADRVLRPALVTVSAPK